MKSHAHPYTLAEIADAQATTSIFAFDCNFSQRLIARLQAVYAAKAAQLEAFHYLLEEGIPDIVLRAANGREVVLRLSEMGDVYAALRDAQDKGLRKLEEEIVSAHLTFEQDAQTDVQRPRKTPDFRPAILALCAPEVEARRYTLTPEPQEAAQRRG